MMNPFSRQPNEPNRNDNFRLEVQRELLRQCKHSFNMAVGAIATSYGVTLLGVGLLYADKVPESAFTATTGAISSLSSINFANAKKQELQDLLDELDESS